MNIVNIHGHNGNLIIETDDGRYHVGIRFETDDWDGGPIFDTLEPPISDPAWRPEQRGFGPLDRNASL
jgi:hypothetical protein